MHALQTFLANAGDIAFKGLIAALGALGGLAAAGVDERVPLSGADAARGLPLAALLAVMLAEGVTTALYALRRRRAGLSAKRKRGFWGVLRWLAGKALVVAVWFVAGLLDSASGADSAFFQGAAAWFYVANEALALLDNLTLLGVPIPAALKRALLRAGADEGSAHTEAGGG